MSDRVNDSLLVHCVSHGGDNPLWAVTQVSVKTNIP